MFFGTVYPCIENLSSFISDTHLILTKLMDPYSADKGKFKLNG